MPDSSAAEPAGGWPGHGVLQVPVPALEPFVRARYERDDPSLLGRDPGHVHAHLTVLTPLPGRLTAGERDALAALLRRWQPFDVVLTDVATFANGIIHVVPAEPGPFEALRAAAQALFPDVVPYGGAHLPTPHVTIDATSTGATEASVRAELCGVLPAIAHVDRVQLVWYRSGEVAVRAEHRLGPSGSTMDDDR